MSSSENAIGRVLGRRYRVVRRLGVGGMGSVYEAVQEDLGRRVAVKVIARALAGETRHIERFRREAMATARLGHPNVVQVSDFLHPPGELPFLVMELLEGESLASRLGRGGALAPTRAVSVARQVLAALECAHARGIVHRDLKPANTFLVPLGADRDLVKVLDFGVAKLMDSASWARLTQTGAIVGTVRYAAPEQLADSKSVDLRADVFAAGTLLYCMLAGQPPHTSTGSQLILDILHTSPEIERRVPEIDPALGAIVRRALARDPSHRFDGATEMREALEALALEDRPSSRSCPTRPSRVLAPTAPMEIPPTASVPPARRSGDCHSERTVLARLRPDR
ncbi:MAG: serine/threonine protein kinase [Myxococcales bacterium]|nr:serine/threonine protein kinase [Myxococcales bacterium]